MIGPITLNKMSMFARHCILTGSNCRAIQDAEARAVREGSRIGAVATVIKLAAATAWTAAANLIKAA